MPRQSSPHRYVNPAFIEALRSHHLPLATLGEKVGITQPRFSALLNAGSLVAPGPVATRFEQLAVIIGFAVEKVFLWEPRVSKVYDTSQIGPWLKSFLEARGGTALTSDIKKEARLRGFLPRPLKAAKRELGIIGTGRRVTRTWTLPNKGEM